MESTFANQGKIMPPMTIAK